MKLTLYIKLNRLLCAAFGHIRFLDDDSGFELPSCNCKKYPSEKEIQSFIARGPFTLHKSLKDIIKEIE